MKILKLALLLELELGCVWTLIVIAVRSHDAEFAATLLFVPIYGLHLVFMITGGVFLWKRPETRALAAAVVSVPVMLLFVPIVLRMMVGGPVEVPPAAWLVLVALPLGICLFLPHHVAGFLPEWTLRSRWLNVSTVVMLAAMIVPWAGLLVVGPARAAASSGGSGVSGGMAPAAGDALAVWIGVLAFAALSAVVAGFTFLTSYVGLFQRVDRSLQKLRVTQLILSIVVLAPSVVTVAIGLGLLAIAMVNPG